MSCISADFVFGFLIRLAVFCGLIAILKLVVPYLLALAGINVSGILVQIINIIIVVALIVMGLYICWVLWDCTVGGGLSLMPRR